MLSQNTSKISGIEERIDSLNTKFLKEEAVRKKGMKSVKAAQNQKRVMAARQDKRIKTKS